MYVTHYVLRHQAYVSIERCRSQAITRRSQRTHPTQELFFLETSIGILLSTILQLAPLSYNPVRSNLPYYPPFKLRTTPSSQSSLEITTLAHSLLPESFSHGVDSLKAHSDSETRVTLMWVHPVVLRLKERRMSRSGI